MVPWNPLQLVYVTVFLVSLSLILIRLRRQIRPAGVWLAAAGFILATSVVVVVSGYFLETAMRLAVDAVKYRSRRQVATWASQFWVLVTQDGLLEEAIFPSLAAGGVIALAALTGVGLRQSIKRSAVTAVSALSGIDALTLFGRVPIGYLLFSLGSDLLGGPIAGTIIAVGVNRIQKLAEAAAPRPTFRAICNSILIAIPAGTFFYLSFFFRTPTEVAANLSRWSTLSYHYVGIASSGISGPDEPGRAPVWILANRALVGDYEFLGKEPFEISMATVGTGGGRRSTAIQVKIGALDANDPRVLSGLAGWLFPGLDYDSLVRRLLETRRILYSGEIPSSPDMLGLTAGTIRIRGSVFNLFFDSGMREVPQKPSVVLEVSQRTKIMVDKVGFNSVFRTPREQIEGLVPAQLHTAISASGAGFKVSFLARSRLLLIVNAPAREYVAWTGDYVQGLRFEMPNGESIEVKGQGVRSDKNSVRTHPPVMVLFEARQADIGVTIKASAHQLDLDKASYSLAADAPFRTLIGDISIAGTYGTLQVSSQSYPLTGDELVIGGGNIFLTDARPESVALKGRSRQIELNGTEAVNKNETLPVTV